MSNEQPQPLPKKYADLISEIEKGVIKIPKFQRDFVWSIDKTAKLLDSILKGYPKSIPGVLRFAGVLTAPNRYLPVVGRKRVLPEQVLRMT